jgi:cytochrome P450
MTGSASIPTLTTVREPGAPLDPPLLYARLREEEPISRISVWGVTPWLVTRWEDARTILASPAISSDWKRPGLPKSAPNAPEMPPGYFFAHDAPVHTTFRRALTREFMVKRINALRAPILQKLTDLIDEMTAGGDWADFIEKVALPLPSLVICELLGVPYEDHAFFQTHSKVLIDTAVSGEQMLAAQQALGAYLEDQIQKRRQDPEDNLLSRLGEQVDAGVFSLKDAADLGSLLLFTGHESTANMIGLSVLALLEHPDQMHRLYDGEAELVNAVEELLRYLTLAQTGLTRVATEDITVSGVTIKAGEGVIIMINSANRDMTAFGEPDQLDLARANARQHVAFGYGVHQCLGQPLARMELRVVLPEIFRRLPNLRVHPDKKVLFKGSSAAYGASYLPVIW